MVQLVSVAVPGRCTRRPPPLKMAPPRPKLPLTTQLSEKLQLVRVALPAVVEAAATMATLPLTVQSVSVTVPLLNMPPPPSTGVSSKPVDDPRLPIVACTPSSIQNTWFTWSPGSDRLDR